MAVKKERFVYLGSKKAQDGFASSLKIRVMTPNIVKTVCMHHCPKVILFFLL